MDPQRINKSIFTISISFNYAYNSSPDEVLPNTSILTVRPHGVHAYFGLGAVWGWVKGKGRPPLVGIYWGTLKTYAIQYLLSVIYAYDESPDEGVPKATILSVPPPPNGVHAYFGLGTV